MNFANLGALARHAAVVSTRIDGAIASGVRMAAKVVLKRTRAKFGAYQTADGPFQTWPPLTDETKRERVEAGFPADEPLLRTGALRDSYEMDAEGLTAGVGSSSVVAEAQELGVPSRGLPARSTLGMAFVESERDAFDALALEVETVMQYGRSTYALSDDLSRLEPS